MAFLASHQTPHSIDFLYGGAYGLTYMKYLPYYETKTNRVQRVYFVGGGDGFHGAVILAERWN